MLKIKLFAVACVLSLTAIVLSISPVFVSKADGDRILQEIAVYKSWQRITKEPIKVDGNTFIVDGQEITNYRTGVLSG